jgi:hypothetical protein
VFFHLPALILVVAKPHKTGVVPSRAKNVNCPGSQLSRTHGKGSTVLYLGLKTLLAWPP